MRFNKSSQEVKQTGEIKKNSISIDKSNMDFIVTILSTNLYSNPINSFIRETVSNAWDSHIEAGTLDPVILELGKNTENKYFCRIQDFGVGLSEERFNKIYRNIGSSTKRNTNDQIGGFGIGRFSALAYSDIVYITSVYNGQKFKYMMYKDGNSISIDLLHKSKTKERNGLEILINISSYDIYKFSTAIKDQLVYFENLYVTGLSDELDIEKKFNNFKIKKYKNFSVNTLDDNSQEISIVLGKVRYPLRLYLLSKSYPRYVENFSISLNFNIGELEVTPNREEILYSAKNIKIIESKLDDAIAEIQVLIDTKLNKNYSNILDYVNILKNEHCKLILIKENHNQAFIKIPKRYINPTLNGKYYDRDIFMNHCHNIMSKKFINIDYKLNNSRITYIKSVTDLNYLILNHDKTYLTDISNLKNITKSYIRDICPDNSYFIKPKSIFIYLKKYIEYLKKDMCGLYNQKYDSEIIKEVFKYVSEHIKNIKKFSDNSVPEKWIKERKEKLKANRTTCKKNNINLKQQITLYKLRTGSANNIVSDSKSYKLNKLNKRFKTLTVYNEKNDDRLIPLYRIVGAHVNIVGIAPTKMKLLKKVENFIKINDFMTNVNYKIIRNVATVQYIKEKIPFLNKLNDITNLTEISVNLGVTVKTLANFVRKYNPGTQYVTSNNLLSYKKLLNDIYKLCKDKNYFNEEIKAMVDSNYNMLYNSQILLHFTRREGRYTRTEIIPNSSLNIITDYILARKLFKPNVKRINKLKKETIFNKI